ncbi:mitochondrial fission ELM1 family protein [Rhodoligotrophos ferricapiens]|uniref:mitochondrial fission ELM1 family protein n=1 Tax=Rhodoligotrophos ferricapiens TaxID=3069264 RepID=UPI00315D1473
MSSHDRQREGATLISANDQEPDTPRVWVLAGAHLGDTAQAVTLAQRLGWGFEVKKLSFNGLYRVPNVVSRSQLWNLTPEAREELRPPWPDLVIAVGRRSVPAALWIRRKAGGKTRLVHLGRPRAPLAWFDLVVTTPQYGLPRAPNVLHNLVPLTDDPAEVPTQTLNLWSERLSSLPRPWIAVLIGGSRRPYRLDRTAISLLAQTASIRARALGGSLLVTTSPRTDPAHAAVLSNGVTAPAYIHIWDKDRENPYKAFLALADRFIVTGESVSMVTEACRSGKPTEIFPVPRDGWMKRRRDGRRPHGFKGLLMAHGLYSPDRDVEAFVNQLVASGHAMRVGERQPRNLKRLPDPMAETLRRVRALFAAEGARKELGGNSPFV